MPRGQLNVQQAKEKMYRYCAYQERCHYEVKNKLFEMGVYSDEAGEIISALITENYLNEERFAKAFAGGKFRMKKWGRLRIVQELEAKQVTKNCIKIALREIEEEDYNKTLSLLLENKLAALHEENLFQLRDKLAKYAINKGYEPALVWDKIKAIVPD